ncbi:hypothetical protein BV22DRAFT_1107749 [Leucogyrophana mollusca]|uniref:Uncharacterized protein n=1 Tax=Leucogyrophana mollusca TaxID=85980 RepID=A0ACB8B502_9AGAM|nr:hypothetical protein BV22DRAFT_1107749 [Leucogyrophana mollusca]
MDFTEEITIGGWGTVISRIHASASKDVYRTLMGVFGVPWKMWPGKQGDYNTTVVDTLGSGLEDLFKIDVKPANFVLGTEKTTNLANVIDFGLAETFRDLKMGAHISNLLCTDAHGSPHRMLLVGRHRVPRLHAHFLCGTLPWRQTKGGTNSANWDAIIHVTKLAALPLLTAGLSTGFATVFEHTRGLEFGNLPSYEGLWGLFRDLAWHVGVRYDGVFDWMLGPVRVGMGRFGEACNARRWLWEERRGGVIGGASNRI